MSAISSRLGRSVTASGSRSGMAVSKEREWLAQYPYPAQPARSDRFTVGRE
ncbi:hypothetical protein [Streptomyces sp. ET3-23]|uniref:hypothetical protein n=1 Tax=Streptomyces sp. ET3-23 TaxID=2885643 RepID=UPI0035B3EBB9